MVVSICILNGLLLLPNGGHAAATWATFQFGFGFGHIFIFSCFLSFLEISAKGQRLLFLLK
jgi:hypothetical protein